MNNTDKLLRAFIEASGFEIETLFDHKERKLTKNQAGNYFTAKPFGYMSTHQLETEMGGIGQQAYLVDSNGMYTERLINPIVDYKVTKKAVVTYDEGVMFTHTHNSIIVEAPNNNERFSFTLKSLYK